MPLSGDRLTRWLEGGDAALSRDELARLLVENPPVPFRALYDLVERAKLRVAFAEAEKQAVLDELVAVVLPEDANDL